MLIFPVKICEEWEDDDENQRIEALFVEWHFNSKRKWSILKTFRVIKSLVKFIWMFVGCIIYIFSAFTKLIIGLHSDWNVWDRIWLCSLRNEIARMRSNICFGVCVCWFIYTSIPVYSLFFICIYLFWFINSVSPLCFVYFSIVPIWWSRSASIRQHMLPYILGLDHVRIVPAIVSP